MGVIDVTYYTDPACPWSWAAEPAVRRVISEFGDQVAITYVMGGVCRRFEHPEERVLQTLDAVAASGMPMDARIWLEGAPRSTHPAGLAVKAAAEQGVDGAYLRLAREAILCERRAMDTPPALLELARRVEGLDATRFAIDLESSAIVEAFGADLERARAAAPPATGSPRTSCPTFDVGEARVHGSAVGPLREAVLAAGAQSRPLPGVEEALGRFGRMATAEVAAVCDLAPARAAVELARLAGELRVRPEPVAGAGALWSLA
jgi:predicted DsbA family dithiol-disulfide isomerase